MKTHRKRPALISPRERLFARAYVNNGFKAGLAARMAGYTSGGASMASRLLAKPHIAVHIGELMDRKCQIMQIDKDYIAEALVEIRELDLFDIIDEDGQIKSIRDWPVAWRRSISGLDFEAVQQLADPTVSQKRKALLVKKIKLPDKLKAIELLGRHVDVKAWEKDEATVNHVMNVMPVPVADSVEAWEEAAAENQKPH